MNPRTSRRVAESLVILLAWCAAAAAQPAQRPDIRKLSQHFIDARDSSPWHFSPAGNIKDVSLSEHRGLVTLRGAGHQGAETSHTVSLSPFVDKSDVVTGEQCRDEADVL